MRALAELLQPSLKPSRGPTPDVPNIMAAILLARDASLGGRGACRLVPGVNEDAAHSRVAKLAVKVRALLDDRADALPRQSLLQAASQAPLALPAVPASVAQLQPQEGSDSFDWDLPPLMATLEPPSAASPPSPTDAETPPVSTPPVPTAPPALATPAVPLPGAPPPQAVPRQSRRPHPFDRAAYDSFEVPESARADLDKNAYLQREALREPELRSLLPPALRRRRPLPAAHAALAASKGHTGQQARRYIKNYGYLHGIGPEPEDLGDDWEGSMFTPTAPDHKPQKWYHDDSSDSESRDSDEGVPPILRPHMPHKHRHRPSPYHNAQTGVGSVSSTDTCDDYHPRDFGDDGPETELESNDSSGNECPEVSAEPDRWGAFRGQPCPTDVCYRCGLFGHWRRDCTEIVCGNCKRRGHYAADCPKPAPCFRCGQLGHWAKGCPELRVDRRAPSPANTETRWVIFQPPTLKTYRHHCSVCRYATSVVTKASGGMPRHKCNGEWCLGSNLQPGRSELLEEREDLDVWVSNWHLDLDSKLTS